jgi:hypothetical protein
MPVIIAAMRVPRKATITAPGALQEVPALCVLFIIDAFCETPQYYQKLFT